MERFRASVARRAVIALVVSSLALTVALLAALPSSGARVPNEIAHGTLPSAKQLISDTLATMSGQQSVRLTIKSTDKSSKESETVTEDAGKSNGLESIQFGTASASVRLTTAAAYISGNTAGLERIIGLDSKGAKSVGQKWIVVKKGASQFKGIVDGGTIGPLAKALLPTSSKSVSVKTSKFNGQNVFSMTWTQTSSNEKIDLALVIASRGARLPIQLTASEGTFTSVTSFSKWGEHISVDIPKVTIDFSKVPH